MRRALAAALVVVVLAGTALALDRPEGKVVRMTNTARHAHGLGRLNAGPRLSKAAERHAQAMADKGALFHGHYVKAGCWGQNVGVGPSVWAVHRGFMRSPAHRTNVLGSCFDRIGVGVVRDGDRVWVVENFAG